MRTLAGPQAKQCRRSASPHWQEQPNRVHAAPAASSVRRVLRTPPRPRAPLTRVLLLLLAITINALSKEDEEGRKKKITCRARVSVTGERGCDEVYVFVYACSWAQVVSIRIMWHICRKRKIIMACF